MTTVTTADKRIKALEAEVQGTRTMLDDLVQELAADTPRSAAKQGTCTCDWSYRERVHELLVNIENDGFAGLAELVREANDQAHESYEWDEGLIGIGDWRSVIAQHNYADPVRVEQTVVALSELYGLASKTRALKLYAELVGNASALIRKDHVTRDDEVFLEINANIAGHHLVPQRYMLGRNAVE